MKGRFPDILNNPATGEAARKLYDDAQEMLDRIDRGEVADARNGVIGLFPANAVGDDIEVYTDDSRADGARRAAQPPPAGPAPRGRPEPVARATSWRRKDTGLADYVGALRGDRRARQPGQGQGVQGRARRLLARSCWSRSPTGSPRRSRSGCTSGCARSSGATPRDEQLDNEELIAEKYDGIRPAPGYPACPEHTEKATLWELLDVEENDRHRAHREHGDVARRVGERLVLLPPAVAVLRRRPDRPATRSRTTRSARAGRWPRRSGGCPPTSATSRRTEPRGGSWPAPL